MLTFAVRACYYCDSFLESPSRKRQKELVVMKKITVRIFSIALAMILLLSACGTAAAPESESAGAAPAESTTAPDNVTPDAEPNAEEPAEPEEPEGEVELTMAVVSYMQYISATYLVGEFNNQSDKYKITIKDYSDGDEYDRDTAIMRLNVDIGSGKFPDLILFDWEMAPYSYISHGYLLDMLPLIDADEDMSRDDIAILKALTKEGGLYFLNSDFAINSGVGLYSRFGDRFGWTLDEYLEIESESNGQYEMVYTMTSEIFIESIVSRYITDSIDWTNGVCDINNDTFIALLEAGKKIQENPEAKDPGIMTSSTYPARLVANGKRIMAVQYITNVAELAYQESLGGERFSFIGEPTIDGSNGSSISLNPIGICAYTEKTKGCWAFMKYLLTEKEINHGLPVYRPRLMEEIENAKVEVIEQDNAWLYGESVLITDEDAERFLALLEDTEHLYINDKAVMDIVTEEAMAYFNGGQSVERTAELIQSRVQIYVSEQS